MEHKVSVIIPVFNGQDNISIPLNSLLQQTSSDFEVIIIDDGSTDNTKEIIEKYVLKDKRFKYYFQSNLGVSSARNRGVDEARGQFICFLDSDDFYENTYIEKMLNRIEIDKADICYCGYNVVFPRGKKAKKTKFKTEKLLLEYILGRVAVHTTGWLISRTFLEKFNIRFTNKVSWGEDIEFFCEVVANSKKHVFVSEYLTNYRVNFDKNQLSSFSMDKLDKDYASIQRILSKNSIIKNKSIEAALLDYRLQALLTYRMLLASKSGVPEDEILNYYNKYKTCLKKNYLSNGLRSIKLIINKFKLSIKLRIIYRNKFN